MPHLIDASTEAVTAARRAYHRQISQPFSHCSSLGSLQTTALLYPPIEAHSPSVKKRPQLTRPFDNQASQRQTFCSTCSWISSVHNALATSPSIADFETQTSAQSDQYWRASNRPNLLYTREFPTKENPLPGWQLHLLEDEADSFELLQEPDQYLHSETLRKGVTDKCLSWKAIIKVRAHCISITLKALN